MLNIEKLEELAVAVISGKVTISLKKEIKLRNTVEDLAEDCLIDEGIYWELYTHLEDRLRLLAESSNHPDKITERFLSSDPRLFIRIPLHG